jgi:hypothetical protein
MSTKESPIRPKGRVKKILLRGACALAAIGVVSALAWRYSGTGEWVALAEKDGVKAYYLKAPGTSLKKFKAVFRVKSTVSMLVKFMKDPSVCDDVGCHDAKMIEVVNPNLQYQTFRYDYPFPFKTREFVVRQQFTETEGGKGVLLEIIAEPDKIPANDCCVRVAHMHNSWRLTPIENGEVEVAYVIDMDEGGFIPDYLLNAVRPEFIYAMSGMQEILNKEKYQKKYQAANIEVENPTAADK